MRAIKSPIDLSCLTKKQAYALDLARGGSRRILMLWQASKCHFDYPNQGMPLKFHRKQELPPTLMGQLKGKSVEQTQTYAALRNSARSLKLPSDFDCLTPGARVTALARARADPAQVPDILALGADLNILRTVKKSLPSARS